MNSTRTNTVFSTRRGGRTAFTLIELMTVVLIIMLLLTILTPTIAKVRVSILCSKTRHTINLISNGCREYELDFGDYPVDAGVLVQNLTGRSDRDGEPGYGFRPVTRGKVYGPYGGTEKLNTSPQAVNLRTFMDAFGGHIFYYRYDVATGYTGEPGEPVELPVDPPPPGDPPVDPTLLKDYMKGPEGKFYRRDFVLISPGPNGEWDAYYEDGEWTDSDDIANFKQ